MTRDTLDTMKATTKGDNLKLKTARSTDRTQPKTVAEPKTKTEYGPSKAHRPPM